MRGGQCQIIQIINLSWGMSSVHHIHKHKHIQVKCLPVLPTRYSDIFLALFSSDILTGEKEQNSDLEFQLRHPVETTSVRNVASKDAVYLWCRTERFSQPKEVDGKTSRQAYRRRQKG